MPVQPPTRPETGSSNAELLDVAREAGAVAASIIRHAAPRARAITWREKSATDFVSEVDVAAEAGVMDVIRRRLPSAGILAEESASSMEAGRQEQGIVFVVDPLDGTTNFLHGFPEYAVSVGVLRDGAIAAGVVINVPLGEVFTATAGGGAFLDGEAIRVSTIDNPQRSLFATGFPFQRQEEMPPYLAQLGRVMARAAGIRRPGAASLDLANVACGRFEGFWETRLSPWDVAAGMLLVREAGGVVTTLDGAPCPVARTSVVAGSAVMHPWLLSALNAE